MEHGQALNSGDVITCEKSGMKFLTQKVQKMLTDELADPFGVYYFLGLQIFTNNSQMSTALKVGYKLTMLD